MIKFLKSEPVWLVTALNVILTSGAFAGYVSANQTHHAAAGGILGVLTIVQIVGGLFARSKVKPLSEIGNAVVEIVSSDDWTNLINSYDPHTTAQNPPAV